MFASERRRLDVIIHFGYVFDIFMCVFRLYIEMRVDGVFVNPFHVILRFKENYRNPNEVHKSFKLKRSKYMLLYYDFK